MFRSLAARFAPVGALTCAYLLVGTLLRAALQLRFGPAAGIEWLLMPQILARGLANDMVESLYLFAPLVLLIALLPERAWRVRGSPLAWRLFAALGLTAFIFLACAEFLFFDEFDARFNIVAFDYLLYPTEVIGDIRSEYPVTQVLLGSLALGAMLAFALRRWLPGPVRQAPLLARAAVALGWLALLAGAIAVWPSDALSSSDNRVARELVQNGHSTFFRAMRTSELDYHAYYRTAPRATNLQVLASNLANAGGRFVDLDLGRIDREFAADPRGLGRLNVVVVVGESFGAEFSALYGAKRDWTPNFDRHARQGVWFAHAYASGSRTVRGLEALTCSIPPIPPASIVRRPGGAHVSNWGRVMQGLGYHTSFLYGGYGYFDNMNAFYGSNGFQVLDRAAITKVRYENVWGVSDEDLFDRALEHFDDLDARKEPFFSMVMTTSNHKPFTFRPGLEALGIPEKGGGREAGVRYADYALGRFLDQARTHRWFDDTVFVVIADHGARVYGRQDIPLKTYEIPALIYAPAHLAPRRVDTLFGQIDVAPTVLGLLGLPYRAPFFGIDVLRHPLGRHVALFSHNHDIALMRDDQLVVLGLNRSGDSLTYDATSDRYAAGSADPDVEKLTIAYYQTAFELFREGRF
jgi:phosphoglycerol transferase MdoB-like AlkP superfamily enzyme